MSQGAIFINYRKQDSEWKTETLYKELLTHFDENSIFKDFTTIEPGDNYRVVIDQALNNCSVLLVIIGKEWTEVKNSAGKKRLDDPSDFVRIEIATALKRGIRVIPVLFDNIEMPMSELPEDIKILSEYQAISVSKVNLKSDVERLATVIKKTIKKIVPEPPPLQVIPSPPIARATPEPRYQQKENERQVNRRPSQKDLIFRVIIGLILLFNTYLYFSYPRYSPSGMYLVIVVISIISIIISFNKNRMSKTTLFWWNALLFTVVIVLSWTQLGHFRITYIFIGLLITAAIALPLVWKEKYKAAQAVLLVVLIILSMLYMGYLLGR